MVSEISQTQKTNTVWLHLHEVPRIVKFIGTEKYNGGPQGLREKDWGVTI